MFEEKKGGEDGERQRQTEIAERDGGSERDEATSPQQLSCTYPPPDLQSV